MYQNIIVIPYRNRGSHLDHRKTIHNLFYFVIFELVTYFYKNYLSYCKSRLMFP